MSNHRKTEDLRLSRPDSRHPRHISNAEGCSDLCDTGSCWARRYGGPLGSNKRRKSEKSRVFSTFTEAKGWTHFKDVWLKVTGDRNTNVLFVSGVFEPVQLLSSDQSLQSLSPSQSHASRMQTPRAQVNSPGPHWWASEENKHSETCNKKTSLRLDYWQTRLHLEKFKLEKQKHSYKKSLWEED